MRFRTGLVIGEDHRLHRRPPARRNDPDDARPPGIRQAMARHPSTSRLASHGRRLAERATWKSAEAIQRARANVQRRMEPDVDDLPLN
jgi:hypothetical protein